MPTRSLGDLRLKFAAFNQHNFSPELGYRTPYAKFNGPYISAVPDIQIVEIGSKDAVLVMGSDGLWDEVGRKRASQIAKDTIGDIKKIALKYF